MLEQISYKDNLIFVFFLTSSFLFMEIQQVEASFSFEDVTDIAGMTYQGFSWGSTWGDFDVDGFPDLWVSNHESGSLFHNNGNGTFTDISPK